MKRKLINTLTGTEYTIENNNDGKNHIYLNDEYMESYSDKEVLSYIFLGIWRIEE